MTESKNLSPIVSVIVPCYNNGNYLAEALESVLTQTYATWECIILDDGSTDNSARVAQAYTEKDKRFSYIYQINKGVSAARNAAIKTSSGKYILPLDADDKLSPEYVTEAVKVLEKNNDIKLVYCKAELFGKKKGSWNIPAYSYKQLLIENLIFCSAVFRKNDFEKTRGYNEKMALGFEDWEFWLTFLSDTDKVFQLPGVHFYYRINKTSRNTELDIEKQKQLRAIIYSEHRDTYDKYFRMPDIIFDNYTLNNTLSGIQKSKEYLIGRIILAPIRFLMKLFK
jgi:glycosyltransferase involved in cell wall biosynthesis